MNDELRNGRGLLEGTNPASSWRNLGLFSPGNIPQVTVEYDTECVGSKTDLLCYEKNSKFVFIFE
jgi:hypothetical protein